MAAAVVRLGTSPFKGKKGASSYFKDVTFAMMRSQLGALNLAQFRYMNPWTSDVYIQFAKDSGFAPDTITLPSGTQAHWIGNKNAQKTIVYFHGGGYVLPANAGQMKFLADMKDACIAAGRDTAVLLLAYTTAPEAKYPTQLTQAIELLTHLIETEKRDPANITLGGDSAGGNLTIGVLAHLAHPNPAVPTLSLPSKFHATFLISPWVSFNTFISSFETNAEKDAFDGRVLRLWSAAFLGSDSPFAGDFYSEPVTAPASFWEGVANVVDEVLIWGGADEVLIEGIEEFMARFKKGFGGAGGKVTTAITERSAHEEMILDVMFGYKEKGKSHVIVEDWVKSRL
ncbi:alpha/beta hydrolase fold protein-like protein [Mytilinidion resinicola]|uniref:Alpha/beta hydrolase fold protein-like protein n=1 Tax=Mytilinidion resinicola TaxID=574789 RepID=A0A6A6YJI5_9PEZI|nr:alpha/beta hydrolase fold protein-like protein [Mytilinidion resinicola]KAF2809012.1 alpha/beta hydrolase fold protein-like protein [Mytilinidion resinicola]